MYKRVLNLSTCNFPNMLLMGVNLLNLSNLILENMYLLYIFFFLSTEMMTIWHPIYCCIYSDVTKKVPQTMNISDQRTLIKENNVKRLLW